MEKLTIKKIFKSTKKKDGTPYPYPRCSIITQERGEVWISGKWDDTTDKWKEGDIVDIQVEQKGNFLNFYIPETPSEKRIRELEARVLKLENGFETRFAQLKGDLVFEMTGKFQTEKDYQQTKKDAEDFFKTLNKEDESVINPEDIPF